jgi:hypothetical protein
MEPQDGAINLLLKIAAKKRQEKRNARKKVIGAL